MAEQSSYQVVVVGAGFGGLGMAMAMQQAGIEDFLLVDKAGGLGGTWRDNTYPGAACDVPSNLYSYSFLPGQWSRRYSPQQEILAYLRRLAGERGIGPRIRAGSGVASAVFDERRARWDLTLEDGSTLEAAAVVSAVGQLNKPSLPDIAGTGDFAGPSWHSARWNHDVDLAGKRVAVIGTGASAIQFVPEIAKTAAHVDVYQRTPPYVLPKSDRPYGPVKRALFERLPIVRKADRLRIFLYGELLTSGFVVSPKLLATPMLMWRRNLDSAISDPVLREACVPGYTMGCKRVLFSNDWYPALARPNVSLVTDPIERITAEGVQTADSPTTGGRGRPADVIVYGTGFRSHDFLAPMDVAGRDGRRLDDAWRDGAQAYLGISVAGFPNFFLLYGPGTNLGGNSIIYMLEGQIRYALSALQALEQHDLDWLDVRPEVQRSFQDWARSASSTSVWESGCQSWYTAAGRNINNWPDHTFLYRYRVRHFDLGRYQLMPRRRAVAGAAEAGRA